VAAEQSGLLAGLSPSPAALRLAAGGLALGDKVEVLAVVTAVITACRVCWPLADVLCEGIVGDDWRTCPVPLLQAVLGTDRAAADIEAAAGWLLDRGCCHGSARLLEGICARRSASRFEVEDRLLSLMPVRELLPLVWAYSGHAFAGQTFAGVDPE